MTLVCLIEAMCDKEMNFMCDSETKCIPLYYVCDGEYDCLDHTDEFSCG